MIWTIQEGIGLARIIEPIAIANGFHVALGGSVLQQGTAEKDLDLFLYVHTSFKSKEKAKYTDPDSFVTKLTEIGFEIPPIPKLSSPGMDRYKVVKKTNYLGRAVDFIFLLPT